MSLRLYKYVISMDFGLHAAQATLLSVEDGKEVATTTEPFEQWARRRFCDSGQQQYRLHPQDVLQAMERAVHVLAAEHAAELAQVIALGVCARGSCPLPLAADGSALALSAAFRDEPDALCLGPMDRTAIAEAAEITRLCHSGKVMDYTAFTGGRCDANALWPKVLHVTRSNPRVRDAAATWVELCDWVPAVLIGHAEPTRMGRSRQAAGQYALWHQSWGGLPGQLFFAALGLTVPPFPFHCATLRGDRAAGRLCAEWAHRLHLPEAIVVGVGTLDAQMAAVGGGIAPATLVRIGDASSRHVLLARSEDVGTRIVTGMQAQVPDGILPGVVSFETPPGPRTDGLAWLDALLSWGTPEREGTILGQLDAAARQLPPGGRGTVALDWFGACPQRAAEEPAPAVLISLAPDCSAPMVYRALIEALAFSNRAVVECLAAGGLSVARLRVLESATATNPLALQVAADVLDRPVDLVTAPTCRARGAAICVTAAAGEYRSVWEAERAMAATAVATYHPAPSAAAAYRDLYQRYRAARAGSESRGRAA